MLATIKTKRLNCVLNIAISCLDNGVHLTLVPMNLVIFLRNLLPGRWSYRSFSWRYIKYVALWIWRGEAPWSPSVVIRWLATALLFMHFRSRLLLLRRRIILEDSLSPEKRTSLLSRIDKVLEQWRGPRILHASFTYGLPAAGFLLEIYRISQGGQLPVWTGTLVLSIVGYSLTFVMSAFMVKRGLMLEGSARSSYFPGSLGGRGAYADEHRIFQSIGVARREFPLDILVALVAMLLGYFTRGIMLGVYKLVGIPSPTEYELIIWLVPTFALYFLLSGFALFRRMKLGRG